MTDITGRYQLNTSDNFDAYLKAIGVGIIKRNLAKAMDSATVDITKNGDEYTLKTTTPAKTSEVKFVLGKSGPETTMDGREVQSTFNMDGNILRQKQSDGKDFESTIDREFTEKELIATIKYKDVTAVRKYKKVNA